MLASSGLGVIYALDRSSGAILWSLPGAGTNARSGSPATTDSRALTVVGDALYSGSLSGWFIAYDLIARKDKWRVNVGVGSANSMRLPADADAVYLVSVSGDLAALSLSNPGVRWLIGASTHRFYSTVAIGEDRVFVSAQDGFYAIRK